jgi:hypothetical protein
MVIVLCILCDIKEKTYTDWAVQRMTIRKKNVVLVDVSVSWLSRDLGSVLLVNLKKTLLARCMNRKGQGYLLGESCSICPSCRRSAA